MKLLTDENISSEVVGFLRELNYDVLSIPEAKPGMVDSEVLHRAFFEERIVITCDKDFGELIYNQNLPTRGVILLRLKDETNRNKVKVLDLLFKKFKEGIKNKFIVVTESKVRVKQLKSNSLD